MNAVVLTAVLSCLNPVLYTFSRMLSVPGSWPREAPAQLIKLSRCGVPYVVTMCLSIVGRDSVGS